MPRRLDELAVGMGPTGDVPYDRTGAQGVLPVEPAPSGMGQAVPPVQAEPGGMPRMGTDALSDQDLETMQMQGTQVDDPINLVANQQSQALMGDQLDPQMRAQLEEQQRLAALRALGLG